LGARIYDHHGKNKNQHTFTLAVPFYIKIRIYFVLLNFMTITNNSLQLAGSLKNPLGITPIK